MNEIEEIWKPIEGFEEFYEVSSLGRVKALDRCVSTKDGKVFHLKEMILKPNKNANGYMGVKLYKNGKGKMFRVNRLVANSFIPNPNNYQEVNHKDEDKNNNSVYNLEWCSRQYNVNYGERNAKASSSLMNRRDLSKPVCQYTLDDVFVARYPSAQEAEREKGFQHSKISNCCMGKRHTHKGFKWKYEN